MDDSSCAPYYVLPNGARWDLMGAQGRFIAAFADGGMADTVCQAFNDGDIFGGDYCPCCNRGNVI